MFRSSLNKSKNESRGYDMNYCEDFDTIKAIIEYCDDHIMMLRYVHYRGGHEDLFDELTLRLQKHLMEKNYVDENLNPRLQYARQLQKITLFLVLNTDITFKYNLKDDPNIAHVLQVCPQLTKCLLTGLIWELKLDKFFYDILSYTPCWFSFQFFDPSVVSLKFVEDAFGVLDKVENLVKSIFTNLTRSDKEPIDTINKKIIFGKYYNHTMELLRQFYTPDSEKFISFKKAQYFRYSGFAMRHLLDMTLFCFDGYEHKIKHKMNKNIEMFEICKAACPVYKTLPKKSSDLVKDEQLRIIFALLNSLQYNVMLVTIDSFMSWAEIDLTTDLTLQAAVSGKAYQVLERMAENKKFRHDLVKQLQLIAIRPKPLVEILEEATLGEILCKLDNFVGSPADKKMWLDELFNRSVSFGNDECMDTIRDNIKLVTLENCKRLLDFITMNNLCDDESMDMENNDPNESAVPIINECLKNFNCDEIIELICYQVDKCGHKKAYAEQDKYNERCTEFFNKFINTFDLQEFLYLCFENPDETWSKFFAEACTSQQHIANFCSTVKKTTNMSSYYLTSLLDSAFDTDICEEKFFPNLICEIFYELYSDKKPDFFTMFVNIQVNEMLRRNQYKRLNTMVKALILIANRQHSRREYIFGESTPPVLLMSAQIMENCRWDLITYSDERDEVVRSTIEFVQTVSKKFLPIATGRDKRWISTIVKDTYRPITQYYFQKYALTVGEKPISFDKFVIPLEITQNEEAQLFLIMNYVRCTKKETEWLAQSERLLPHVTDMIITLGEIIIETAHENAFKNYRHCILNYANIVKKFIIPAMGNDNKKFQELGMKLLEIMKSSPREVYEEIFMFFQGLLLEVFEKASPIEEDEIKKVRIFVRNLDDCKAKEIFSEKFLALATENSA